MFVFHSLLCVQVFIGLSRLFAMMESEHTVSSSVLTLFPDFSWSIDFILSPCQPIAVRHQRSCDCVHWMLISEVQILQCWVLLWGGCCRTRNGLTENCFSGIRIVCLFFFFPLLWLSSSKPDFWLLSCSYHLINAVWSQACSARWILLKGSLLLIWNRNMK